MNRWATLIQRGARAMLLLVGASFVLQIDNESPLATLAYVIVVFAAGAWGLLEAPTAGRTMLLAAVAVVMLFILPASTSWPPTSELISEPSDALLQRLLLEAFPVLVALAALLAISVVSRRLPASDALAFAAILSGIAVYAWREQELPWRFWATRTSHILAEITLWWVLLVFSALLLAGLHQMASIRLQRSNEE